MAGVIASVSLHNEKDRTGGRQFANNKSNYVLPEFDKTFQPVKHNIFFIRSVNHRADRRQGWIFLYQESELLGAGAAEEERSGGV